MKLKVRLLGEETGYMDWEGTRVIEKGQVIWSAGLNGRTERK